jgi:hypothetical protein
MAKKGKQKVNPYTGKPNTNPGGPGTYTAEEIGLTAEMQRQMGYVVPGESTPSTETPVPLGPAGLAGAQTEPAPIQTGLAGAQTEPAPSAMRDTIESTISNFKRGKPRRSRRQSRNARYFLGRRYGGGGLIE